MISKTYNYHQNLQKNTGSYRKKRITHTATLEFVTEDPDMGVDTSAAPIISAGAACRTIKIC